MEATFSYKQALEKYNQAVGEMKRIQADHPDGKETFSAETTEKWSRAVADLAASRGAIELELEIREAAQRSEAFSRASLPGGSDGKNLGVPEPRTIRVAASIPEPRPGDGVAAWLRYKCGRELDGDVELMRARGITPRSNEIVIARDLETGTGSEGGYTVHAGLVGRLVQARDRYGILRSLGTVMKRGSGEPFKIPTNNDTANYASVVAEEGDSTGGTDPVFAEADLTPYKLDSKILKISEELMEDAQFNMEEYIGEILGARLWRGQEYYACQGTGSSQPGGIASGATSALTAASATEVTASEVIQLTSAIDEVYRGAPNARIVMNSTTLGEIETLVAGDGHYLLHHFADGAMTIQGMRIVTSSQMPDTSTGKKAIAAGDFNFLAFNEVGPIRLKWLDQLYQGTGQIGVRAYMRSGSAITCPTAIKVITMA